MCLLRILLKLILKKWLYLVSKEFTFDLNERLIRSFFKPIRKKEDSILLIMNAIQFMSISSRVPILSPKGRMVLIISKMSRVFFYSGEKHFSIAFPYTVEEVEGEFRVFSSSAGEINEMIISKVKSVLSGEGVMSEGCISLLADSVLDESLLTPNFWSVLRELLLMEDGYLRYDHDPERESGHIHPLNHLDVFYSSKAGFKVGLSGRLSEGELIDIMDYESDCRYLHKP
jgi:hypothetical protein